MSNKELTNAKSDLRKMVEDNKKAVGRTHDLLGRYDAFRSEKNFHHYSELGLKVSELLCQARIELDKAADLLK